MTKAKRSVIIKSKSVKKNPLDKDIGDFSENTAKPVSDESNNYDAILKGLSDDDLSKALLERRSSVMLNQYSLDNLAEVAKQVDGVKISDGILIRKLLEDFFAKPEEQKNALLKEAAKEELKRRKIRSAHRKHSSAE